MWAPGSGSGFELWEVLRAVAFVAGAVLVLIAVVRVGRWGRRSKIAMLTCVVVMVGSGIGYRIAANDRYHIAGLTDTVIDLFELADGAEIDKGQADSRFNLCGGPISQNTTFHPVQPRTGDDGPGEGAVPGETFAAMNRAADQLEADGWTVGRFQEFNDGTGQLARLRIRANRDSDYLEFTMTTAGVGVFVYADDCLAERHDFGDQRADERVDRFEPNA